MSIYPRKNPYLIFERIADGVEIYPFYDRDRKYAYLVTEETARFLMMLDGHRSPYEINRNYSRAKVDRLLEEFRNNNLLFQGRCLKVGIGSVYIPLVLIDYSMTKHRRLFKIVSALLMCIHIPFMIGGLYLWKKNGYTTDQLRLSGLILGMALGLAGHEIAHAVAGIGYRAKVVA